MAQVGPTAPHDAHSTEYMPASSSRIHTESGESSTSDNIQQLCQPPQQVALVLPRVEPPTGSTPTAPLAAVSTSHAAEQRPVKRTRVEPRPGPQPKRTRVTQRGELDVEYQVPTSSRCDQDDEGVIVVDSDDERCTRTAAAYPVRYFLIIQAFMST